MREILLKKINNKSAIVSIIGLGYVGLPLAVEFSKKGFQTIGIEISKEKISSVNEGKNYISDVKDDDLKNVVFNKRFFATDDFSKIKQADFIVICVPTPLDNHQQPDLTYIKKSSLLVSKFMKKGSVIVLESTTYPGTTEGILKPMLEKNSFLRCEKDFYLGFSPERVDPGNSDYNTGNTPKIVGAIGQDALDVIATFYENALDGKIYKVSSPKIAEMEKILENTYRNINIGLVNEIAVLCHRMDINVWEVIEAAKTKPYGFHAFYPGSGLGGHCIPLDPYYLSWKAREYNFHTSMIEASAAINDSMPEYCVNRIFKILNRFKKSLNDSRILILGVAYKKDISDCRESPSLKVIEILQKFSAKVDFFDSFVKEFSIKNNTMKSIKKINQNVLKSYDLVVLITDHTNVDYEMISKNSNFIFDTKNAFKNVKARSNIELL